MASTTKVLIVEDDRHTREVIQRVLTRDIKLRYLNIECFKAGDGAEGIERFLDVKPDLVIVDLLLPKISGFKVIETIRAQPDAKDCQILVITGVYRDREALEPLEQQGIRVQLKPFLPQALAATVHQVLARKRGPDRGPPRSSPSRPLPRLSLVTLARDARERKPEQATPIEGSLDQMGLPHLLLDALEEQLNGSLELRRGKVRKVIYLMAGHPVFVQSNLRGETLGQMLVRRGKLTVEQHTRALERSEFERIKYGEALVRLGYMSEGEVMDELREQTQAKIAACLVWKDGTWRFTEDPEVARNVPCCVVDPLKLVFEGLQSRSDPEQAFSRLAEQAGHRIRLTRRFHLYRDQFDRLFGTAVSDAITSERSVQEVLRRIGAPQQAVPQIDMLLQTGLAELTDAPADVDRPAAPAIPGPDLPLESLAALDPEPALEPEAPPDQWEESSAVVWLGPEERSRVGRPPSPARDPGEVQVALQLIQSTYLTLHEGDHYHVLGVTPQSDADSIEVAYQVKRKQFDLDNFRDMDLGEHYAHLEEICGALDRAHEVLSDPLRRAAYDRSLDMGASQEARSLALSAEMHCRRGEELFNRERYSKAMEAFARALDIDEQAEYQSKYALALFMARRDADQERALADAMILVQAALATDPGDKTAHLVAATISDKAGHHAEAVAHLEQLIRLDPTSRDAFDELERILLMQDALEQLEQQYRRLLHLLGDQDPQLSGELWRRLTLFYRDRLGDSKRMRTAGEVALRFRPDDRELREILTELDHQNPERWPQAVLGYRSLLAGDPSQPGPIHRLFELHQRDGRTDAAYVVAAVAELRGAATEQERQVVSRLRGAGLRRASRPLEPSLLEGLRHVDDDPSLATLFRVVAPLVERLHPLRLADVGVTDKDIIDEERLSPGFADVLRYAAKQLSLPPPRVALNLGLESDVQCAGTEPPLLLCGPGALESDDQVMLAFRIARTLYQLGPGRRLAAWRPRRVLRDYVLAALSTSYAELEVPDATGSVAAIRDELRGSPLQAAVEGAVADLRRWARTLDLSQWQRGIQRTADRVGLLLCTDVITAGLVLVELDDAAERDMVDFALSEAHSELRASLGLAVG